MQVFIKNVSGRTTVLDVGSEQTVAAVKQQICDKEGIPVEEQRLCCGTKQLADDLTLADLGIEEDSTLEVFVNLLGGGKKRKKKTYTTAKKEKHKHRKVKLAVLKYYKVDENNKITRLRRECDQKPCVGPNNESRAIFMAIHYDRYACGLCGYTLLVKHE